MPTTTTAATTARRPRKSAAKKTAARPENPPGVVDSTTEQTGARTTPLQEKVVLLILSLTAPGNQRAVKHSDRRDILSTEADKNRLNVIKRLIDAKEHEAIGRLDGEIRGYIHRLALPSPFKTGTHAIPVDLLASVDGRLLAYADERRRLIDELAAVYEKVIENARMKLGPLFRASDYLAPDQLQDAYTMNWQYVSLNAPGQLNAIDGALFRREQDRLKKQWDEALDDMRDALRVGLAELVDDMVKRLTAAGGEDAKRFKPSKLLDRFTEFLATFDARNVTSDAELAGLAAKARQILRGVSSETLTQAADVQVRVKKEFGAVQAALASLEIESASRRRIVLED